MPDVAAEAVGEAVKWGVAAAVGLGSLIGRLWLDARDARREREALRCQMEAAAGRLADLARAAAVEAMMAAESEARRRADEALALRLDRVESDVRGVDRSLALMVARAEAHDEARRGPPGGDRG